MKFTLECECGNKLVVLVPLKKYAQLRDYLKTQQFHYDGAEIKDGKLKEIRISCDKCRNYMTLGLDYGLSTLNRTEIMRYRFS